MKKLLFSFIIPLLLMLVSCMPDPIDIEVPQLEPKIVVASQIIPGQFMFIALTKSFGALEQTGEGDSATTDLLTQLMIEHALVTVSYSGKTDTLFRIDLGFYASLSTPQMFGQEYTLYVYDSTTKQSITAKAQMLSRVTFIDCEPELRKVDEDTIVFVNLKYLDPSGENWYMVNVYRQNSSAPFNFDLNSFFSSGADQRVFTELISDQAFASDTISVRLELPGLLASDSLAVTLSNINPDYYKFLNLRKKSGNLFSIITQEAISYPSNVQGGYGFFNTHFPDVRLFDLNNYEVK